ncbi:MAG: hypothetical protein HQL63_15200, partial [Magnetococcales bacterium]|nr:hypothetical protein [Magnetococcales bacterium]
MNRWEKLLTLTNQSCFTTFGVPVSYRPALRNHPERAEQIIEVTGIFNEHNADLTLMGSGDNSLDIAVPQTTLELRPSDLGFFPNAGDEVTVNGTVYQVVDVQPVGREMA